MSNTITVADLFNIGKNKESKISTWKFGDTLKEFIAQDSANKLDSQEQEITGVTFSEDIKGTLKLSKWKRLRKKIGKELSRAGSAAVVVDIIQGSPYISMGTYVSHTEIGGILHEVELWTDDTVIIDEAPYPIHERFYLKDGKPHKEYGVRVEKDWIVQGEPITYPANITRIPVKIFANNEESTSDIANTKMADAISQLNDFNEQFGDTFQLSQFGLLVNRNMTGGKTGKQILEELKKNKTIEVNGLDAQLGAGVSPIGSQGYLPELMLLINYLEDKILKYSFTTRDTTSSGANKHNAEVGMFNQFAIEYLLDKKEIREEDYADFYTILGMFYNEDLSAVTVELKISQVLQNLLDAMNPETPMVQENINKDETSGTTEEEK